MNWVVCNQLHRLLPRCIPMWTAHCLFTKTAVFFTSHRWPFQGTNQTWTLYRWFKNNHTSISGSSSPLILLWGQKFLWPHPNPFRGFSWPTGMQKNDTLIYSPTMTASTGLHKFSPNLKPYISHQEYVRIQVFGISRTWWVDCAKKRGVLQLGRYARQGEAARHKGQLEQDQLLL